MTRERRATLWHLVEVDGNCYLDDDIRCSICQVCAYELLHHIPSHGMSETCRDHRASALEILKDNSITESDDDISSDPDDEENQEDDIDEDQPEYSVDTETTGFRSL